MLRNCNDEDYLCFTPDGDDASYVLCIEPIIGTTAQYEVRRPDSESIHIAERSEQEKLLF